MAKSPGLTLNRICGILEVGLEGIGRKRKMGKMDTRKHAWRIEKKVVLKGWQFALVFGGTFEEAVKRAAGVLKEYGVFQVRFAKLGDSIKCGYYIPQWLGDE